MKINLKPIHQQVVLINGATSEIGGALIKEACARGARVFMIDEDEEKLARILKDRLAENSECAFSVAQTGEADQLRIGLEHCLKTFGTVDTWINAQDDHYYSLIKDFDLEVCHKIFERNFWAAVTAGRVAADYLASSGGVIINLGVLLKRASYPLSGLYLSSKNALASFSEVFNNELKSMGRPVMVKCLNSTADQAAVVDMVLRFAQEGTPSILKVELKKRYQLFKDNWGTKNSDSQLTSS